MNQIYSSTPGEAWLKACKLVMEKGHRIKDDKVFLKEVNNLFITITKPDHIDKILNKYQNRKEKRWMKQLWLGTRPLKEIPDKCNRFPAMNSYGSKIFAVNGKNYLDWVIQKLKSNPDTKSATLSLINIGEENKTNICCTSTFDFKIRNGKLFLTVFIRSHDAYKKLPYDILFIGQIERMAAKKVGVPLGALQFFVASEHIYETDFAEVTNLLKKIMR